ncbi:MAG: TIGR02710 family CRISPR-associated protein [Deltaproteobacteria bacterium]|nr:TIGR02710 family CRISPR-associated protein [Deltaproteobacteria bacterium]
MKKAMIITVGTGRTGKDIAHAICVSIKQQNPDNIVFIKTNKTDDTTMPFIRQDTILEEKQYEEIEISDPNDVEKIADECQQAITALSKKGYDLQDMVADYTSGTKAMSAGLTIAAIKCNVGALVYVAGDRGEGGRVMSGTERPIALQPNRIIADSLFQDAIRLFNIYQYDACLETLMKARKILADPAFIDRMNTLETLSKAYMSWDKFQINESFNLLKESKREKLPQEWGIESQIKNNRQVLYKERENKFCEERMVDLLENARRRGEVEKKFDDAIARLYRLCEYIAQFHISQKNLYREKDSEVDTSDLDLSNLPANLQEKYRRYRNPKDGKVKLSLHASYDLLFDLDELPGKYFFEDENKTKKFLGLRNNSILAHGFNPVSEKVYKEMFIFMEDFVKKVAGNFAYIRDRIKFPLIER